MPIGQGVVANGICGGCGEPAQGVCNMCWEQQLTSAFTNSVSSLQQHPLSTACNPNLPEDKFVVPPDELHDVCSGRPSKWGNGWKIGVHGTRDEVVDKYEAKVLSDKDLICEIRKELPNLSSLKCANSRVHYPDSYLFRQVCAIGLWH